MNSRAIQASSMVERIVGAWRGATAVTVVGDVRELPVVNAPADVRGMYRNGATWIVSNTQPSWQVPQTLAHEVLGHHSMRVMLGQSWRPFMDAVQHGIRGGDWRLGYFRQTVRGVYTDDSGACVLSPVQQSDEIVAAIVEARFDGDAGRLSIAAPMRKMTRATLGHIAREAFYIERPADFDEVEGTLLVAEHRLRHGGMLYGIGSRLKGWYAGVMSKPWNPKDPPMSLAQSEFLLREDADQQQAKSDRKGLFLVLQLILAALLLGAGILGFFWNVGATFGLFR